MFMFTCLLIYICVFAHTHKHVVCMCIYTFVHAALKKLHPVSFCEFLWWGLMESKLVPLIFFFKQCNKNLSSQVDLNDSKLETIFSQHFWAGGGWNRQKLLLLEKGKRHKEENIFPMYLSFTLKEFWILGFLTKCMLLWKHFHSHILLMFVQIYSNNAVSIFFVYIFFLCSHIVTVYVLDS